MNPLSSRTLNGSILISIIFWVLLVGGSFYLNYDKMRNQQYENAFQTAQAFFQHIVLTREWIANHGGVYVPVTETTRPNPYIQDPLRDLEINKKLSLTKVNPALMTRQLSELALRKNNIQFHITSLTPLRPENRATERERVALLSFNDGNKHTSTILTTPKGQSFFYMAPLVTKTSCLKCHNNRVGDIRGGISITLPHVSKLFIKPLAFGHLALALAGILGIILFWAKLHHAYSRMKKLAVIDSLTGIPNRRSFSERINEEYNRSRRSGSPLTVLMCDIDNFKEFNDTYGHGAGDTCLTQVAHAIDTSIRRPSDFCARYGGEEFIVILPDTDSIGARPVAENILKSVRSLNIQHSQGLPTEIVTISIGTATSMELRESSYEKLITAADTALYDAKANGKNCVSQGPFPT